MKSVFMCVCVKGVFEIPSSRPMQGGDRVLDREEVQYTKQ